CTSFSCVTPVLAQHLLQEQRITAEDAATIAVIWCFGRLIANTDMHTGNLSFYFAGNDMLILAPVYDMLPMAFAPLRSGAMASSHVLSITPVAQGKHWRQAYGMAEQFWAQLVSSDVISAGFRDIAQSMQLELQAKKALIERMA
ncbi:MAG: HipA domain-containing protein, partial [Rheinheimera sp.]|nr:HipA domain-containing protein [Rheinheimera sp.]